MSKTYRIAVIPGDGIGKEVMPEGLRALEAVGRKFGIEFKFDEFDWSCDYYLKHGRMLPDDWKDLIGGHDAIFFGAVGDPGLPWGSTVRSARTAPPRAPRDPSPPETLLGEWSCCTSRSPSNP